MREDDGGRDDALVFVVFDDHAGAGFGFRWIFHPFDEVDVFIPGGIAHEAAGLEPLERRGAVPESLVVGVEGVACLVKSDATWGADAGAGGDGGAVETVAIAPAAPG